MSTTDVIEAMRSIQTEGDRWHLAEALRSQVPQGSTGFEEILDEAASAGVAGALKVNTLRLYRDTANRWPATERVPNVSFSAHREAMVLESTKAAAKMLADLSKNLGPHKVTVASVRKAIAIQRGNAVPAPAAKAAASTNPAPNEAGIIPDLMKSGRYLIGAITPKDFTADELDQIGNGLTKVLAHVDRLRAKEAQKAQAAAKRQATPKKAPAAARKRTPAKPKADVKGDLRNID
jgi:hypothetical protein